jgi:hypothetical protein
MLVSAPSFVFPLFVDSRLLPVVRSLTQVGMITPSPPGRCLMCSTVTPLDGEGR